MEYINIGKRPIKISRVGFGTGSSGFTGVNMQTRLQPEELAGLLAYAFEKGVNFWDTGFTYGTYPHVARALKIVPRREVVISTKFSDSLGGSVRTKLEETLKTFKTDYLDICLLHGARNSFEVRMRTLALEALIRAKEKGHVRMAGLSAHGIGAIEAAIEVPEIEVLFARINWSGASMDACQENFLSKFVAIPYVKEAARQIIPRRLVPSFSAQVESMQSSPGEQEQVKGLLRKAASRGKHVVGMKVFGAGRHAKEAEKSLRFIMAQEYIEAFLLGMVSRKEVDENLRLYHEIMGGISRSTINTGDRAHTVR